MTPSCQHPPSHMGEAATPQPASCREGGFIRAGLLLDTCEAGLLSTTHTALCMHAQLSHLRRRIVMACGDGLLLLLNHLQQCAAAAVSYVEECHVSSEN